MSTSDISFEDSDDVVDFMEEDDMLYYENGSKGTSKKQKHKGEINESENDNEELKNECESDENNRASRKKHLVFKLQKDMTNYKWNLGTYFTFKCDL